MPPKKSNLNNARSRQAQRKRVERANQSEEQIRARNAAQRIRTAEARARETREQRDERLRQTIARTRAARLRNIARARVQERQRQRKCRSLKSALFDEVQTVLTKMELKLCPETKTRTEGSEDDAEEEDKKMEIKEEATAYEEQSYCMPVMSDPLAQNEVQTVLTEIKMKIFPQTRSASADSGDDDQEEQEIKIEIKEESTGYQEQSYCVPFVSDDPLAQESQLIDRMATDVAQAPKVAVNINSSEIPSLVVKEELNPVINTYAGVTKSATAAHSDKAEKPHALLVLRGTEEQTKAAEIDESGSKG